MRLSQRLQQERAFVERSLGDSVICLNCRATLQTFTDACTADLKEQCSGFLAIEQAKKDFATERRMDALGITREDIAETMPPKYPEER